jgi:hypothetical protein
VQALTDITSETVQELFGDSEHDDVLKNSGKGVLALPNRP